jgi:hypothetical protein
MMKAARYVSGTKVYLQVVSTTAVTSPLKIILWNVPLAFEKLLLAAVYFAKVPLSDAIFNGDPDFYLWF